MLGTVKAYNPDRGFGFIGPDSGGADVFVHIKEVQSDIKFLATGDRVSFEVVMDPKRGKPQARGVTLVEG